MDKNKTICPPSDQVFWLKTIWKQRRWANG